MVKKIKIFDPCFDTKEQAAINKVLRSHLWSLGMGTRKVFEFERKFRDYVGSKQCVAVNSGTAALHLALSLFDMKNKEVIIPSLTHVSVAHAITHNGGRPVFADIELNTLNIEPESIAESISPRTELVIPVHFAGLASNLTAIDKICRRNNIDFVEDAALATGSSYNGKKIGSHGKLVCFSFHPVKNLAMIKGGAITLNGARSNAFRKKLVSRRWNGTASLRSRYDVDQLGWNYYMDEFSAAIGVEQLKKINDMTNRRREIGKRYSTEIINEYKMPYNNECSYNFYWFLVKNRNNFIKKMKENHIEIGTYHPPIHMLSFYRRMIRLPNTERIARELVCIPNHPNLDELDVDKIIKLSNKFV
ncbi:MAG: DegT/DnrJ/EryC1/StrS family aminotransferase [Candidatus Nitrosotenuis sp.]